MALTALQQSQGILSAGLTAELQSLVAQLHGAHIVIDADYRIVAANDAYREAFAAETGIDFLALRIGYFQRGENVPGAHMGLGEWGQSMWLSNRDLNHAIDKAIDAPPFGFAIIYLMSDRRVIVMLFADGRRDMRSLLARRLLGA